MAVEHDLTPESLKVIERVLFQRALHAYGQVCFALESNIVAGRKIEHFEYVALRVNALLRHVQAANFRRVTARFVRFRGECPPGLPGRISWSSARRTVLFCPPRFG
eukprot:TRINITY_DN6606_c0_g1_i1.p2 TRINITY_DN6606_c0_g1~~TRINITY_DN6606_c0_g1_i1.p2  ORF type:complete len:114 (+),score=1.26 TRINITY_DN6606_c0_g1_i1:25-342(+)